MRLCKLQFTVGLLCLLLAQWLVNAQSDEYVEGEHYAVLPTQFETSTEERSDAQDDRIEVIEFFAYNCKFCYQFEAHIADWLKNKANDVSFAREHVWWSANPTALARAYYAAVELDVLPKVHIAMFKAIHDHKLSMSRKDRLSMLFVNGAEIEPDTFDEAYGSATVNERLQDCTTKMRVWRIAAAGTPSLVVGGKYLIDTEMAGGHSGMFPIVDYLVNKIRTEREESTSTPKDDSA